jgi:hypothetical protein
VMVGVLEGLVVNERWIILWSIITDLFDIGYQEVT